MKIVFIFFFLLGFALTRVIGQTINAGADTSICLGGTATLHAEVTGGGYGTDSYTFETYTYSPESYTGGTQVNFPGNQDDQIAGPFDIGFSFCFFNQTYTQFYIGTNGWVGFTYNSAWITYTSAPIPSTAPGVPKNCIMAPWQDWWPNYYPSEKNVYYYTTGTAPNRKLVVYWWHCPMYGCYTTYGTFQIVLNETTSIVENHLTEKPYCSSSGGTATQGVHKADGLVAFTATGRNSTVWTATNESTRFVPSGIKWYTGGYPGGTIVGYGENLIISPTVTTTYTAVIETCGSGDATDDVTVTVIDPAFNYPQSTYCSNDPDPTPTVFKPGGIFSATPSGLIFISTATGQVDLSASTPGTYSVTYTISAPCTISETHPLTIIALPNPPVAAPDTVSRCDTGKVTLNVVQIPGTNIQWYDSPTGGFHYSFSGTPVDVTITATTTFYAEAVSNTNSCPSLTRTPIVGILKPIPSVTNTTLNFEQCSQNQTNISIQSSVTNSTFTWTATSSSPDITGFSNGSGNLILQTLSNSGFNPGTVTYSVIPHAVGCDGVAVDFIVTVNPVPDVYFGPSTPSICSGQQTNIGLGSNVSGSAFTWTATASSPSVTGYSDGSGNLIAQILITPGIQVESVTYHITPTANGCTGPIIDYVVIINPEPVLTNQPMAQTICSEQSTNINLTASCLNTTFTWTASLISGNITGFTNGSGPVIAQALTNLLTTTGQVQYTITPEAGNCTGNDTNYLVDVKPMPHLTNSPTSKQICNNTSTNITLNSDVTGTLFTWTCTPSSANISGFTNSTNPATLINQTLVNSGFANESVTYHITPHANGCDGVMVDYVLTVFPTPDLANTDRTDSICDSAFTNISLTSHVIGTQFTWRAFGSSPSVTGYSNSAIPGLIINQQLENNGVIPQTVTYRLLPSANGCIGDSVDFVVTVFPTPDLSNGMLTKEICNNNNTNITLTSNVSGTLFTWTCTPGSANITGYSHSSTPLTQINQNLINTGNVPETVTYHITPHANGCSGWVYHYVVTVIPSPYLTNSPLRQTQCNNQNTNLTLTSNVAGTQFNWTASASSPALTGYSNSITPGTVISQTLGNTGFNVDSVTYHVTPETSGCSGSVTDYHVLVFPTPDLSNSPKNKQQCNNLPTNITLTSNVSGTLFTWTCTPSSANISGFANSSNPAAIINQTLVNSGFTIETVNYHITPHANGCDGAMVDYVVTVYPSPDLSNNPKNKQQCNTQPTNILLTSNVTGTLFTWTCTPGSANISGFSNSINPTTLINQILVNSGFANETVTYHISPHANGCDGSMVDYVVTVYPTPDLANTDRTDSICDSAFTSITLTSHVTGTLFTWRAFGSSPLVTGYSNSALPGLTISQRLENNGFIPQTVTYRLLPAANGCIGDSVDFVVTVFPTPDLSNSMLTKEICNNNNTNITLTSNVSGTLFAWTCTPGSANITGYSNSTNPVTLISQNLINTGNVPETVTYHITPHANGCSGWVYHYVVTVIPSPYLTNTPLRQTQCNNQNTNLILTSNVAGSQFNWTASASSPALTGYSNSITPGTVISQTLGNTGFNVDSVTYHVTPETSGCPGSVTDYHVVVFPIPDVYFIPNGETLCEGVASGLSLQSQVSGTTYSWTTTASSPNLSGYYNGSGNMIVQTISNAGTTTETVTYHVTPQANGCPPGSTQNVILTVKPRPVITNTTTIFQLCTNTSTAISLLADVPGSTFAWRAFGSSPGVSGFLNGAGFSIIQTLVNTGFNIESVTYRVAATATGCSGDSTDFTVTVFPLPDVYFTPNGQTICPLQTTNITNNSHVAGTTYTWTATGSSLLVSGHSPGSGNLIQQTLDNSGPGIESVTYHVAPSANGCPGTNSDVIATVDPAPVVSFSLCIDPVTTTNAQPIKLKGGIPINGTYSGRGVSSSTLFPALAGTGLDTIYYSYTNTFGCVRNNYIILSVVDPLPFTCGTPMTDPRDGKQYPTVQIVTQCWMTANLDYGQQLSASATQRDNCTVEKYCYNDNPGNCTTSGGLYQWDELMKYDNSPASQGLCPPEWHIPTENEWNTLFSFFLGSGFAGSPLKVTGYSGFNALLDGVRLKNVSWNFLNFATFFWSSTPHGNIKAWAHGMNDQNPSVSYYPANRSNAFSVRCIKD